MPKCKNDSKKLLKKLTKSNLIKAILLKQSY